MHHFYLTVLLIFSCSVIQAQVSTSSSSALIKLEKQKKEAVSNGDYRLAHDLKQTIEQLKDLEKQKKAAAANGEYVRAHELKQQIEQIIAFDKAVSEKVNEELVKAQELARQEEQLSKLEKQKNQAVANKDFRLAHELKVQIEKIKNSTTSVDNNAVAINNLRNQITTAVDNEDFALASKLKKELDALSNTSTPTSGSKTNRKVTNTVKAPRNTNNSNYSPEIVTKSATQNDSKANTMSSSKYNQTASFKPRKNPNSASEERFITDPVTFTPGSYSPFETQKLSAYKSDKYFVLAFRSSMKMKDEEGKVIGRQLDLGVAKPTEDYRHNNHIDWMFGAHMTDDFKYLVVRNKGELSVFNASDFSLTDSKKSLYHPAYSGMINNQGKIIKSLSLDDIEKKKYNHFYASHAYGSSGLSIAKNIVFTSRGGSNTHYLGKSRCLYYSFEYDRLPIDKKGTVEKRIFSYQLFLRDIISAYNKGQSEWRTIPSELVNTSAPYIPLSQYADHVNGEIPIAEEFTDMLNEKMKKRKERMGQIVVEPNGKFAFVLSKLTLYPPPATKFQNQKPSPIDNPLDNNIYIFSVDLDSMKLNDELVGILNGHKKRPDKLLLSESGRVLISHSSDENFMWILNGNKFESFKLDVKGEPLALNHAGNLLALANKKDGSSFDGLILYNLETGKVVNKSDPDGNWDKQCNPLLRPELEKKRKYKEGGGWDYKSKAYARSLRRKYEYRLDGAQFSSDDKQLLTRGYQYWGKWRGEDANKKKIWVHRYSYNILTARIFELDALMDTKGGVEPSNNRRYEFAPNKRDSAWVAMRKESIPTTSSLYKSTEAIAAVTGTDKRTKLGKQETKAEYHRSSLYTVMINDTTREHHEIIRDAFGNSELSQKFNDHNIGPYLITTKAAKKNQEPILNSYLDSTAVARELVARWFNRDEEGKFNMDLVASRGMYDASAFDVSVASASVRGNALLADAGEELIDKTFVIVYDFKFTNKEDIADKTSTGLKIASAAAAFIPGVGDAVSSAIDLVDAGVTIAGAGYVIKTTSYLYRLDWNEAVQDKFYRDYWVDENFFDPTKREAFERSKDFKLKLIGSEVAIADIQSSIFSKKSDEDLIHMATVKAVDKAISKLQRKYEEFRTASPLYSGDPLSAKIGLKEGLKKGDKFEVLEQIQDTEGRTEYKRIGQIKVDHENIWDNTLTLEELEVLKKKGEIDSTPYTLFTGSGKFAAGQLIKQIN